MYTELPRITRCCFCVPLRYGLLVWAYIKLMFSLFVEFVIVMRNLKTTRSVYTPERIVEIVVGVAFLIEIAITVAFIVGAHKKIPKLLRVYYRYTIIIVTLLFVLFFIAVIVDVYAYLIVDAMSVPLIQDYIEIVIISIGSLILSLYQLALIKNEIHKLENNTQFSFTNDGTDPKCVIQLIESKPDNV